MLNPYLMTQETICNRFILVPKLYLGTHMIGKALLCRRTHFSIRESYELIMPKPSLGHNGVPNYNLETGDPRRGGVTPPLQLATDH